MSIINSDFCYKIKINKTSILDHDHDHNYQFPNGTELTPKLVETANKNQYMETSIENENDGETAEGSGNEMAEINNVAQIKDAVTKMINASANGGKGEKHFEIKF